MEVRLQVALGRQVVAKNGRAVGRLEEVRVDERWRVTEYLIGTAALLERLSATARSVAGFRVTPRGLRARWDQLDLSNPRRPRLTCSLDELQRLDAPRRNDA